MDRLKLNIGCFNNTVDDWINIDITPHATIAKYPLLREILYRLKILKPEMYKEHRAGKFKNIRRHDVTKGLPFKNESCIYIYSSHFIEHLFYDEVIDYFKECHRILRKGGLVRTVVPDFYSYIQSYLSFHSEKLINVDINDKRLLEEYGNFLMPFFEITCAQNKKTFLQQGHKSYWDEALLAYILLKTGFINLTKNLYREGKLPDLDKLEIKPKGSIYMEAEKP